MLGNRRSEMATQLAAGDRERLNEVFGSFIDETIGIVARQTRDTVSFAVGSPAREALDLVGADDLAATVIRREGASALGYTITEGEPELRAAVASDARARGIAVRRGGGPHQRRARCRRSTSRAASISAPATSSSRSRPRSRTRSPRSATTARASSRSPWTTRASMSRRPRASCDAMACQPRMFFVVPNFQNPSGETLSDQRRDALLNLAASYGAVVIEDDPYGLLRYRGTEIAPLAARESAAQVVRSARFSKTFLPGLRVGWVIADREVDPAHGRREADDGLVDRHARSAHRSRVRAARRRAGARREAARHVPHEAGARPGRAGARVRGHRRDVERSRRRLLLLGPPASRDQLAARC